MTAPLEVEPDEANASWRSRLPSVADIRLSVLFFALWLTAIAVARAVGWYPMGLVNYVGVGAVAALALLLCRRMPLPGLIAIGILSAVPAWHFNHFEITIVPLIVGGFLATASGLSLAISAPVAAVLAVTALTPVMDFLFSTRPAYWAADLPNLLLYDDPSSKVLAMVILAAALLLGRSIRRQRLAVVDLAQQNSELLRLRDADMARAASEERAAVARDIHDVVAHHVAAMVIRAQAAERVADSRPDELRSAVNWIASSGKEALTSMRQVVRVLSGPVAGGTSFEAEVQRLAAGMAETGLTVHTDVSQNRPLAPEQEAAIIRIIQEALTNVMLHSDATEVRVLVRNDDAGVSVSIDDDGRAAEAIGEASGGNGLRGMRDRVDRLGGTISVGPVDPRGWRVDVRIPARVVVVA